jgi:predicted nucleic acid-binding protein
MTARRFVDSNIWVYRVDSGEPAKQARARAVLDPAAAGDLVISSQVLDEFYVTVTRKLARPMTTTDAEALVDEMRRLEVVAVNGDHVATAIAGAREWGISYWDALIVATAQSADCTVLLSEDLANGVEYGGLRVENPFVERHRVSEERATLVPERGPWDDADLADLLAAYEQSCRRAGMRPNAVHSYWDYARRFLDWRTGDYRPRGAVDNGRPVPRGAATADELASQAASYAQAIEAAGREQATVDTYHRHAMFFVRWLRGEFAPGARLG